RGLHRRPVPGGVDRPEGGQPQPAVHRRDHHRGLRLPATAVRAGGQAALPGLRPAELQVKGFSRARVDGEVVRLDEAGTSQTPALKKYEKHTIEVVVDRLAVKECARRRLTDSLETALGLSGGVVVLDFIDLADNDPHRERMYSEHLACLYDD